MCYFTTFVPQNVPQNVLIYCVFTLFSMISIIFYLICFFHICRSQSSHVSFLVHIFFKNYFKSFISCSYRFSHVPCVVPKVPMPLVNVFFEFISYILSNVLYVVLLACVPHFSPNSPHLSHSFDLHISEAKC